MVCFLFGTALSGFKGKQGRNDSIDFIWTKIYIYETI